MDLKNILIDSEEYANYIKNKIHIGGEIRFLKSIAKSGMRVIEAGGYYGLASLNLSRLIGETGKIYVFEPIEEHYETIKQNLLVNKINNAEVVPFALGKNKGDDIELYIDGDATSIAQKGSVKPVKVPVTTLDLYFKENPVDKIDLFNIDAEGSELMILKGARDILTNNNVKVFCEIHHQFLSQLDQNVHDIVNYLTRLKYRVYSVCLEDSSLSDNFDKCEYLYAFK